MYLVWKIISWLNRKSKTLEKSVTRYARVLNPWLEAF